MPAQTCTGLAGGASGNNQLCTLIHACSKLTIECMLTHLYGEVAHDCSCILSTVAAGLLAGPDSVVQPFCRHHAHGPTLVVPPLRLPNWSVALGESNDEIGHAHWNARNPLLLGRIGGIWTGCNHNGHGLFDIKVSHDLNSGQGLQMPRSMAQRLNVQHCNVKMAAQTAMKKWLLKLQ